MGSHTFIISMDTLKSFFIRALHCRASNAQLAGSQRLIKGICCLWSHVITTFNSDIYLFTGSVKLPSMSAFVNLPIGVYCIIDRIAAQKM